MFGRKNLGDTIYGLQENQIYLAGKPKKEGVRHDFAIENVKGGTKEVVRNGGVNYNNLPKAGEGTQRSEHH